MCLSIPGRITEIHNDGALIMGKADFGGVLKEICLDYVPEAKVGQFVLSRCGFADKDVLDEEEAQEALSLLRELATFEDELNPDEVR